MRAAHHTRSRCDRRSRYLVDAEHLESGGRPDDIDDGIVPTDLVEVDLVDGPPVQGGLDGSQLVEDRLGACRHPWRQRGLFDEGGDHAVGAHHHVVASDDGTGAGDAASDVVLEVEVPAREG